MCLAHTHPQVPFACASRELESLGTPEPRIRRFEPLVSCLRPIGGSKLLVMSSCRLAQNKTPEIEEAFGIVASFRVAQLMTAK